MIKFLLLVAMIVYGNLAMAGQSASLVCVNPAFWNCTAFDTYQLQVTITSDADAGLPGAFGIGAQLPNGQIANWTSTGGWGGFITGLWQPADGYYPALPASKSYTVFQGTLVDMCNLTSFQNFSLYAAHGALQPTKEQEVQTMIAAQASLPANLQLPANQIRMTFIQNDAVANQNAIKGGLVYSLDCSTIYDNDNNGGGN